MGVKKINGDLNVTGTIMKNGSELLPKLELVGTAVSRHFGAGYAGNYLTGFVFDNITEAGAIKPGIYVFTYGYCMMALPVGNLQKDHPYYISACILDADGGRRLVKLAYQWTNAHYADDSSGNTEYINIQNALCIYEFHEVNGTSYDDSSDLLYTYIPTGYTGYLFRVPINI